MLVGQSFNHLLIEKSSEISPVSPDMATYPTPPSSSGDSPQPIFFIASPNSNCFLSPSNMQNNSLMASDVVNLSSPHSAEKPYLKFIEQPLNKFRFRYKSEMAGAHGSLCGLNSDRSRKQTYPTVELVNCNINALIRCSIYQYNVEDDFKPHPHRLIMKRGREECDDPHDISVGPMGGYVAQFHSMGIIHTARKNIVTELVRKKILLKKEEIARLEEGVRELTQKEIVEIKSLAEQESKTINLNIVCLRFDAFVVKNDILIPICKPIFSHGINNLKCALTGDLKIVRMDHCTSPARGEKEVFLLVERVTKKNIKIRFFELDDDEQEIWEGWGKFSELDVHHQYAIVFKTPQFRDLNITQPVRVYMELVRPSDNARSEWKEFRYVPNNDFKPGAKRARTNYYSSSSYNSSSFGSNELPTTINNAFMPVTQQQQPHQIGLVGNNVTPMEANNINSWNSSQLFNEDQMAVAMRDIDSAEFQRLFDLIENELPEDIPSNVKDSAHHDISRRFGNMNIGRRYRLKQSSPIENKPTTIFELYPEDIELADRTYEELKSFLKSKDATMRTSEMLQSYFGTRYKTNALHVFVGSNRVEETSFILKLIMISHKYELVEIPNSDGYTPLHIAVLTKNEKLVSYLLRCRSNPMISDASGKTSLHLALDVLAGSRLLELMLFGDKKLVELENYDGESPIHVAVQTKNMAAVKILLRFGANINKKHQKNGFTPLRIAVENNCCDIASYILDHNDFDVDEQTDFNSISPFEVPAATSSSQMEKIISNYLSAKGIILNLEKKKHEEHSDEEMEEIIDIKKEEPDDTSYAMDFEIKSETLNADDLEELYSGIKSLTPNCLDKVATILDESGQHIHLSDLLDITHLIQAGIISSEPSLSKNLLTYAIEKDNVKVLDIRNFLENLDEFNAVKLIDQMAKNLKMIS